MQIATRGKRAIIGMVIGLSLLGLSTGPAFAHADAALTPPIAGVPLTLPYMGGMGGQCMRMMATMDCDMPGMMRLDRSAAPITQR